MYSLPSDNPEAREHISRFFRIYHRGNVSEKSPLAFSGSGNAEAIDCLFQLLGEPSFDYKKKELNKSKEKLNVYNKATAFNFIPCGVTADDVKQNREEIRNLNHKLSELIDRDPAQLEALNIARDNERVLAGLRGKLAFARQRRGQIESEIAVIKHNSEFQRDENFADSFDELLEFFPNVNLPLLTQIEEFHYKLTTMLSQEFIVAKQKLEELLAISNCDIADIEKEITLLAKKDKVAADFARSYYEIRSNIDKLERENKVFQLFLDLQNEVEAQKKRLEIIENKNQAVLQDVSKRITKVMWRINEIICGDGKSAPTLQLTAMSKYKFKTFQDGGTSSAYRGLVVFDLAMLDLTQLPAIAHDSFVLNQIEATQQEKIFEYYSHSTNKQIFIALDNINAYSENVGNLLSNSTVLSLSGVNDDVLFGESWNTKEEQLNVQMSLFESNETDENTADYDNATETASEDVVSDDEEYGYMRDDG